MLFEFAVVNFLRIKRFLYQAMSGTCIISAHLIFCDVKEIAKNAEIKSFKNPGIRYSVFFVT